VTVILTSADPVDAGKMGGKGASLAKLSAAGFPVPAWFVVSPVDVVDGDVTSAVQRLGGEQLAVRSSAVDEDGSEHSFAGQLESFLNVPPDGVLARVADVRKSGFSDRVTTYRRERGLTGDPIPPAVIVQQMVDADFAGVAFGADPVSGHRSHVVVSAVAGLGEKLVSGDADADSYRLARDGTVVEQKLIGDKPLLSAEQLKQLTKLATDVSRFYQRPQDIEWAIKGDKLYLLQSRPITSLANLPDPDGIRAIWDNSNIAESYSGITTPLTFSFAKLAYEGVYRQFCKLMKVPAGVIAANDTIFGRMLGMIRGRVYYNLLNWYRLLAMLPGFSVNQAFMEQMMGVSEGLPKEIADELQNKTWSQKQGDRMRLLWTVGGLVWQHLTLAGSIKAFYKRLNVALRPPSPPLDQMRLDQLADEFRMLERQLLTRWDAPLVNDFLAMIFFGVLGKLCESWIGDEKKTLHNDLIGDEGGIISTEPVKRINEMAATLDAASAERLIGGDRKVIESSATLSRMYNEYLDKFGDRCLEELKLESSTLVDDPTSLIGAIGQTAVRRHQHEAAKQAYRPREAAEQRVGDALKGKTLKRMLFNWVMKNARARVRDRENLRFERTRLFGRVRRIMVEAGRRLYAEGFLREPRDVFYLELSEILGFVEGTSTCDDLKALASLRKARFEAYRKLSTPADRFETHGAPYVGNPFSAPAKPQAAEGADLTGTGCCPGVVRGPVRVIRDPRGAHLNRGEILVAERTDPGWVMLFPAASGILVERGSLLSHSAIVAREMNIPAIVAIAQLTSSLEDGEWVEMDGSTGVIKRIAKGEMSPWGTFKDLARSLGVPQDD
jgi:pyruvate,water dikinase